MRKRTLAVAMVASGLVLGLAGFATNAVADTPQERGPAMCDEGNWDFCIETTDDNPAARMWVALKGDKVQVCDTDADGKRAVGNVYLGSKSNGTASHRYTIYDEKADGSCKTVLANMGGKYNLPEGRTVTFEVCYDDDPGPNRSCTYYEDFNNN